MKSPRPRMTMAGWVVAVCLALLPSVSVAKDESVQVENRMRGQANAPVTLIEYSDFACSYCLKFFLETWPKIKAQYVDTGKVKFIYRDYPRADQGPGVEAAVAARCAGRQGKYWAMHDRLFGEGGRLDKAIFLRHAVSIGLDQDLFERCFKERPDLKAIFNDREEAYGWGFHGTPGFILMRAASSPTKKEPAIAIPGAFPFEMFAEDIDRLLATAPHSRGGTERESLIRPVRSVERSRPLVRDPHVP